MPSTGAMILSVLAFLGALGLVGLSVVAILWGRLRGRPEVTRVSFRILVATVGGYALLLFGAGLLSRDRVLAPEEEKYFCELDCHLSCRVTSLRPLPQDPGGAVWAVSLRTRFDPETISPHRGDAPLTPNPRRVWLITTAGIRVAPVEAPAAAVDPPGLSSRPLTESLRPGETYETILFFPAGTGADPASVLVEDDMWPDRLLIGHEASPFHGRTLLPLPAAGSSVGVSRREALVAPTRG